MLSQTPVRASARPARVPSEFLICCSPSSDSTSPLTAAGSTNQAGKKNGVPWTIATKVLPSTSTVNRTLTMHPATA